MRHHVPDDKVNNDNAHTTDLASHNEILFACTNMNLKTISLIAPGK